MNRLLISSLFLSAALITPAAAAETARDRCLKAADYEGCMKYESNSEQAESNPIREIAINPSQSVWFKTDEFYVNDGRYIVFNMHAKWWARGYSAPGYTSPSYATTNIYGNTAYTTITGGQTTGGVTVPAGWQYKNMRTQIDCKDWTFDQKGDSAGWKDLNFINGRGKVIQDLADEFCSEMTGYGVSHRGMRGTYGDLLEKWGY